MKSVRVLVSVSISVAITASSLTAARAADTFARACVSCHIVDHGDDYRLSTALAAWTAGKIDADLLAKTKASMPAGVAVKGKHPKADDALEDIPAACLDCHSADSKKAPPFTRLMHLVHLTGEKNVFVDMFKSDCRACHKLDVKTGEWSVPSGTEK